jgi:hypothetical protein
MIPSPDKQNKIAISIVFATTIILLIGSISLFLFSITSFKSTKLIINSIKMTGGEAKFFTRSFYDSIIFRMRIFATILLLFALCFIFMRNRLIRLISKFSLSLSLNTSRELIQTSISAIKAESKLHLVALFFILLSAAFLRIHFLKIPLRCDEAATFYYFASRPLYIGLSSYPAPNNHLFSTFLMHISYLFFGSSIWGIRLPALIAGVLLVPISYLLTRVYSNKFAALLAAGVIAASPLMILYSTNARGYIIIILAFLCLVTILKYLLKYNDTLMWCCFTGISVIGLYTIPIFIFPLFIILLWLLAAPLLYQTDIGFKELMKNGFISLIFIFIFTFILYLPVLICSGYQLLINNPHVMARKYYTFAALFSVNYEEIKEAWQYWNRDIPTYLVYLLVIGVMVYIIAKKDCYKRVILTFMTFGGCLILLLIMHTAPESRIWVFFMPLYIIAGCIGIIDLATMVLGKIAKKETLFDMGVLLLSIFLALNCYFNSSLYYYKEGGGFPDSINITKFIKGYVGNDNDIYVVGGYIDPLIFYFDALNVPRKMLLNRQNPSKKIIIIVNEVRDDSIESIAKEVKVDFKKYTKPKLIKTFSAAKLYEADLKE